MSHKALMRSPTPLREWCQRGPSREPEPFCMPAITKHRLQCLETTLEPGLPPTPSHEASLLLPPSPNWDHTKPLPRGTRQPPSTMVSLETTWGSGNWTMPRVMKTPLPVSAMRYQERMKGWTWVFNLLAVVRQPPLPPCLEKCQTKPVKTKGFNKVTV